MKANEFRCICCNEIKKEKNGVWRWFKRFERLVCKECGKYLPEIEK